MSRRLATALAAIVLILTAIGSFLVGFRYSNLNQYMLIQFALAGAWLVAATALVLCRSKANKMAVWLLTLASAPLALLYPGEIIALLISFALRGFT